VPLDQVAVIAVHRPHKGREGGQQVGQEAAPESGGFLRKVEGEVGQAGAMRGALGNREWLHQRNQLPPVHRFYGRCFVASFNVHKCFCIIILYIFQALLWSPEWPLLWPLRFKHRRSDRRRRKQLRVRPGGLGGLRDRVPGGLLQHPPSRGRCRPPCRRSLSDIAREIERLGCGDIAIRSGVRIGDTPAAERLRMRRSPLTSWSQPRNPFISC
jgi:hypothetical protein